MAYFDDAYAEILRHLILPLFGKIALRLGLLWPCWGRLPATSLEDPLHAGYRMPSCQSQSSMQQSVGETTKPLKNEYKTPHPLPLPGESSSHQPRYRPSKFQTKASLPTYVSHSPSSPCFLPLHWPLRLGRQRNRRPCCRHVLAFRCIVRVPSNTGSISFFIH